MKHATALLLGLASLASAQKTFVNFQFRDTTLEAVERGTDSATCLTNAAVATLNGLDRNLRPLVYWSFQAGGPSDYPALRLWICYQGGWNLCARAANPRKGGPDPDHEDMKQPLFLPGEPTVPRKGCDPNKPELGWTPLVKRAIIKLVEKSRPQLQQVLGPVAPVSRELALDHSPHRPPLATFALPVDSGPEMAEYRFRLDLTGSDYRIVKLVGCGTGRPLLGRGEVKLEGPSDNVALYLKGATEFRQNEVYLVEKCPPPQGIAIVGAQ